MNKKQVKNKIQEIKNKQSSDADMNIHNVIFDELNTIVLPYFDQISKKVRFILKMF